MAVAIITGASTGIGRALAFELHRRGHTVGLLARRGPLLEEMVAMLGERAACAVADVVDPAATAAAIGELEAALGACDILIANAGIGVRNPAFQYRYEELRRVMDVNFFGVVHSVLPVLPAMIARESGHLVVISSVAGFRGMPRGGDYCASKAAVSTLFQAWREDLRRNRITVTSVHPGYVQTPMIDEQDVAKPWMMEVEDAARLIAQAIERKQTTVIFPWQMRLYIAIARWLPDGLYSRFLKLLG